VIATTSQVLMCFLLLVGGVSLAFELLLRPSDAGESIFFFWSVEEPDQTDPTDDALTITRWRIPWFAMYGAIDWPGLALSTAGSPVSMVLAPIMLWFYLLLVQITFINLIVAIMTETFISSSGEAEVHWRMSRIDTNNDMVQMAPLPAPFDLPWQCQKLLRTLWRRLEQCLSERTLRQLGFGTSQGIHVADVKKIERSTRALRSAQRKFSVIGAAKSTYTKTLGARHVEEQTVDRIPWEEKARELYLHKDLASQRTVTDDKAMGTRMVLLQKELAEMKSRHTEDRQLLRELQDSLEGVFETRASAEPKAPSADLGQRNGLRASFAQLGDLLSPPKPNSRKARYQDNRQTFRADQLDA